MKFILAIVLGLILEFFVLYLYCFLLSLKHRKKDDKKSES
jgi:hypothetical protein